MPTSPRWSRASKCTGSTTSAIRRRRRGCRCWSRAIIFRGCPRIRGAIPIATQRPALAESHSWWRPGAPTAAKAVRGTMPTSPTDPDGGTLLRFADGRAALLVPTPGPARTALAVPGTDVAIHWLDLAGDLTPAQAAAAARLMLADASAEPLGEMHVAAGRVENGLTAVALAPVALMEAWLADGVDPDLIIPEPLLLLPPAEGLRRRGLDHRGIALAFSAEPELAGLVAADAPVETVGDVEFEAGLPAALADPVVNLRQGAFAK